jgi:hypothetical protein
MKFLKDHTFQLDPKTKVRAKKGDSASHLPESLRLNFARRKIVDAPAAPAAPAAPKKAAPAAPKKVAKKNAPEAPANTNAEV